MNYGFIDSNFYVDIPSCTRKIVNYKDEFNKRARDIASDKLMLCLSSGLDSQLVLHSFKTQGIPFECSFLRLDGYNETEYKNLKILEKKYGFNANVVNINPNSLKEEIMHLMYDLDVHPNHALQHIFVRELPYDYDIVQCMSTPYIFYREKKHHMYYGWYDPDISRHRALSAIKDRIGQNIFFGSTSELWLGSISDPLVKYFIDSWDYFEDNNLVLKDKQDLVQQKISQVLRYEYYIKPLFLAKYWKDELIYFPKLTGFEKVDWIENDSFINKKRYDKHHILIPIDELIDHYEQTDGRIKRFISKPFIAKNIDKNE